MKILSQQDAMDCGPSCLAMITKHYGLQPNVETIRVSCDLSKEGVSLLGISKAAEEIGFKTVGGRLPFEMLAPCSAIFRTTKSNVRWVSSDTYTALRWLLRKG